MSRLTRRSALLGSFALALSIPACAIPLPWRCGGLACELVAGYSTTDERHGKHRRVVPGFDLRRGAFQGLSIGWSDQRLLQPTPASEADAEGAEPQGLGGGLPAYLAWGSDEAGSHRVGVFVRRLPEEEDAFVHDLRFGASLLGSSHAQGLEVGFTSATHVHVPIASNGIYWLRYRSRDLEASTFRFEPTTEETTP